MTALDRILYRRAIDPKREKSRNSPVSQNMLVDMPNMRFSGATGGNRTLNARHRVRVDEVHSLFHDQPLDRPASRTQRPEKKVQMPKTLPSRGHQRTRNPMCQSLHENRDAERGSRRDSRDRHKEPAEAESIRADRSRREASAGSVGRHRGPHRAI